MVSMSLFLHCSKRLTSTGEDEREYQSDHETSWDEFDDRYDNFTAGRERLQEFSGRIPPRKKKTNSSSNSNANPCSSTANESNCSQQRETNKEKVSETSGFVCRVPDYAMPGEVHSLGGRAPADTCWHYSKAQLA